MYNKTVKELVYKYEQLNDLYNVGPVQKCIFEDFVEEIVTKCAKVVEDCTLYGFSIEDITPLIFEEFNMKVPNENITV